MHLLLTDSGLGGLSACAGAERALREAQCSVRITYFNAWPDEQGGYNDMSDLAVRARAFDPALAAMSALRPDLIVIACNTLSVVYGHTAFSRTAGVPVLGIVDAGVELFHETLAADPQGSLVMLGTRTTIDAGVHRQGLIAKGVNPGRIAAVACHGLARAIETNPDGQAVADHIDRCTRLACESAPPGTPLYLGVCCTHYTYVREQLRSALESACGREVRALDPNDRLVGEVVRRVRSSEPARAMPGEPPTVCVVSKVEMDDARRRAIARRVEGVSPATAAALLAYSRVPDLF